MESKEKREKVEDIVSQIRAAAYIQNADQPKSVLRFADRIEAALRREKAEIEADALAVGNAAAMREALEKIYAYAQTICDYKDEPTMVYRRADLIKRIVNAALSAPARNCDRFADSEAARHAWLDDAENFDDFVDQKLELHEWLFVTAAERKGEN